MNKSNPDAHVIGYDFGKGESYSVAITYKFPSRLRLFLRRIRLDHSTWAVKVIKTEKM